MRRHWLRRRGSARITLVFGGWALGPAPFRALRTRNDMLVLDHFATLGDPVAERADYDRVEMLGFSFGVAAMAHWLAVTGARPARLVAVAGTLRPADPRHGIPPDRVRATAEGLSADSFARFCRRAGLAAPPPLPDLDCARRELLAVIDRGSAPDPGFDRIWIPTGDRIVPAAAQEAAWAAQAAAVRRVAGPHVPFRTGQDVAEWLA